LPPLALHAADTDELRQRMPELPRARIERFQRQFGLSLTESNVLTAEKPVADYFEAATGEDAQYARQLSNWITGEIFALLRERGIDIEVVHITPRQLKQLVTLVESGKINTRTAKEVLIAVHETGSDPETVVADRGLSQVSDAAQLDVVVRSTLDENPSAVADYENGKAVAAGFLIGQVMRQMRGTANPAVVRKLLIEALEERKTR
jgi:aspartyl-tRNA(Asn)/glutamyl-tRNA(Gln) amidotransferase subunit B